MPMGERAERAVRGGVRIAAHHRHARQRRALLGPDHVHDALLLDRNGKYAAAPNSRDVLVERGRPAPC